jgi:hypothetical protein
MLRRVLDSDSPLRRLPTSLNLEQKLYLEGIRYAVETIDLSYRRLLTALSRLGMIQSDQSDLVPAFSDAWTF